jgi:hypothetical protein
MEKQERIRRLKEHLALAKAKHEIELLKQPTLKDAHTYCVIYNLSAQQYGPMLEKYIRTKFDYQKNKAEDCTGDCSKNGENYEIKVSLGGNNHTKYNFVQIRPAHDCDMYILTAYHLCADNVDEEGDLYVFKVPKEEIKKIIVSYGGYAHGTVKEYGKITLESINNENKEKEYALRPTVNDKCWKELLKFRVEEKNV